MYPSDGDKLTKLLNLFSDEIAKRKKLFADYNGEYKNYIKNSGKKVPVKIMIINNYDSFKDSHGNLEDLLIKLSREGERYGIVLLLSLNSSRSIYSRFQLNFHNTYVINMPDKGDYMDIFEKCHNEFMQMVNNLKDENVIEYEVDKDRNNAADHREPGIAFLAESRAVDLSDRKGSKSNEHYVEVIKRMVEHKLCDLRGGILRNIELEKRNGEQKEYCCTDYEHSERQVILRSDGASYAREIVCTRKLCGEDTNTRKSAKDAKVEDEENLIYRCNRRHLDLTDPSDHNVVNEADGIGKGVLDNDRDEDGDDTLVKRAVADKCVFDFQK